MDRRRQEEHRTGQKEAAPKWLHAPPPQRGREREQDQPADALGKVDGIDIDVQAIESAGVRDAPAHPGDAGLEPWRRVDPDDRGERDCEERFVPQPAIGILPQPGEKPPPRGAKGPVRCRQQNRHEKQEAQTDRPQEWHEKEKRENLQQTADDQGDGRPAFPFLYNRAGRQEREEARRRLEVAAPGRLRNRQRVPGIDQRSRRRLPARPQERPKSENREKIRGDEQDLDPVDAEVQRGPGREQRLRRRRVDCRHVRVFEARGVRLARLDESA